VEQWQEMVLPLEAFGQQFSSSYAQSHRSEQVKLRDGIKIERLTCLLPFWQLDGSGMLGYGLQVAVQCQGWMAGDNSLA
jgi:hypothetical protein